ncbi:PREDICTED: uncharacterized protein LOC103320099 [Prunus mume]|uniref:Uncharacterized protein LOC103320099 n=1 Tax=Prunus mume TaxID=102107 RepID=A0ABM1LHU7_PRUMU|nr:PREDICTED: uncharacterized protein LOC103320099 [Prunus mume]
MGRQSSSLVSHLKRAVRKINLILLGFKLNRLKLASILACTNRASARQCLSFNDRLGLPGCIEDDKADENRCLRRVVSTRTHDRASDDDDDVDHRADVFIANFRRQLRFERQVSLELRTKDDDVRDKGWPGLCMGHQEKYLIYGKVQF